MTGHGKLCARFPESVNSGRLRIQIAQAVLRIADIASKGFAGSLDRLKRSACPVYCVKQYLGNDSNLLIVFYVQIMPDDFVMQLHRF